MMHTMLARLVLSLSHRQRNFSTQPSAEIYPALKASLRELYKRVHPDLFQGIPAAKEANEHSFKLLQEYLAAAKHGGGIGRTAGLPYRFHFYLRPERVEVEDEARGPSDLRGGEAALAALTKVALTLPPPTRGAPGDALSPATRRAFSRLLAACGIPESGDAGAGAGRVSSRLLSLREFAPLAAEAVHQGAAQQGGPRHEVGAVRTALRLARGATAAFGGDLAGASPLEQLPQLRQLSAVLDGLPALDVSGLRLGIGEGYGVDSCGTVWVHAGAPPDAWARFLREVDLSFCRGRHELAARVRAQEGAVARSLGVALLHAHPQLSLDPAYVKFLEGAAAAGGEGAAAAGGALREVSVRVEPAAAAAQGGEPGSAGSGDGRAVDDAGTLTVPMTLSGRELVETLARVGPRAAAAARRRREQEAELALLRGQVERKLRLRRLARDPGLPASHFRAACLRLLQHSAEVGPLLEGLPVRIAEMNALPPDRSFVDIAWNWKL